MLIFRDSSFKELAFFVAMGILRVHNLDVWF